MSAPRLDWSPVQGQELGDGVGVEVVQAAGHPEAAVQRPHAAADAALTQEVDRVSHYNLGLGCRVCWVTHRDSCCSF